MFDVQKTVINRLSPETIHKIAAGEVIERPANAVKELIENSLDAGASKIVIALEEGGLDLIKVSDNGSGMRHEDALMAWQPHTTSKLKDVQDLSHILTYGFRGEALCSMAAVAEVTVETRHGSEETGTGLQVSNSQQLDEREISRNIGTTITVKNLFLHNPARRKFMGSRKSETTRIVNMVSRVALAHPDIGFRILDQGRDILSLTEGSLKHRVGEILGFNITNDLVPVEWTDGEVHVEGYVCTSQQARLRSTHQYFFINRRNIQSGIISRALSQSYEALPPGRFPMAVLFITLPPEEVDVNVHPTKKEVRFLNESRIFWSISQAVKTALRLVADAPTLELGEGNDLASASTSSSFSTLTAGPAPFIYTEPLPLSQSEFIREPHLESHLNSQLGSQLETHLKSHSEEAPEHSQKGNIQLRFFPENKTPATFNSISAALDAKPRAPEIPYLQLHNGFILFGVESGLMMVNQQAAHERVLYEKTLEELRQPNRFSSQQLLFPEVLELPPADSIFLENHLQYLQGLGFDLETFGGNTFQLRGLPLEVKPDRARAVIMEMVQSLMLPERQSGSSKNEDFQHRLAKTYARVTSIKLGDILDYPRMSALIDSLFATQNPYVAPSGTPIVVRLSMEEIHRKFNLKV